MKIFYRICFIIIVCFALVGVLFTSVVFHEYSHKKDFIGLVDKDTYCFFSYPANVSLKETLMEIGGSYFYYYKKNVSEETRKSIEVRTEKKAYFISGLIIAVFCVCIILEIFRRFKLKEAEEFYNYFKKWREENGRN